jgi:methylglutaconyl-CoA hydratase
VHEVVAAERWTPRSPRLAKALVNAGPEAVRACKQLVQDVAGQRDHAG